MTSYAWSALHVLIVDDQTSVRCALAAVLEHHGHQVSQAEGALQAVVQFEKERPDLVLLDVEMPEHNGFWVARQLRERESGGWTPIVFLSSLGSDEDLTRGIEAGGDDYLVKPVRPAVLNAKLRAMQRLLDMRRRLVAMSEELHQANQRYQQLSEADALTGLLNRRGFDSALREAIAVARRNRSPLTLLLCDVDQFKRYNDALGHVEGDACLRQIGKLLQSLCRRPRDAAARYGGEEFALILPDTPRSGALTFARAMVQMLQKLGLPHPDSSAAAWVSVSGGITTCIPDESTTAEGLLMRADEGLYMAKSRGRNRIFSFEIDVQDIIQSA